MIKNASKENLIKRFKNMMNIMTKNIMIMYIKLAEKVMLIIILIENKEILKRKKI